MKTNYRTCFLSLLFSSALLPGSADELITDRPDATESSAVIQPGFVQSELGWLLTDHGDGEAVDAPQLLLRAGIAPKVELRVGWDGYHAASGKEEDGAGDGEIGAKIYLLPEQGIRPEIALLASLSVPWGSKAISNETVDPGFRFACSHSLSDRIGLGYNLGVEWETEEGETEVSFLYTAAVGYSFTNRLGAYAELFGDMSLESSGEAHSLDGGFTYALRENIQLDILGGVGLSGDADDWFTGAGISFRLPR